jgi:hypothetical protein
MQRSVGHVLVFVLAAAFLAVAQQPQQAPCSAPEYRQFDFWVGHWDASWPASPASEMKAGHGTNNIEAALDNCVVIEHFDGTPGMSLRGTSVSTFNRRMHKWQQTWVDNEGSYLDFIGEFKDGKMIFTRKAMTRDGKSVLQRMVWKNITPEAFDWSWERSTDGGKTWDVLWPIHYVRKHSPK